MRAFHAVFLVLTVSFLSPASGFQSTVEPTSSSRYQRFIKELFEKFDKDGDGSIQKSEHENVHYPLLNHADLNGDGKVTPKEVLAWVSPHIDASESVNSTGEQQSTLIQQQIASRINQRKEANPVIGMNRSGGALNAPGTFGSLLANPSLTNETKKHPKTVDVSFVALELPVDLAKHEIVSLNELKEAFADKSPDKLVFEDKGLRLLDLCEFSAVDGQESKITIGKTKDIEQHITRNRTQVSKMGLGSSIRMVPFFHDGFVELDLEYASTAINKNDRGVRQLDTQTKLIFSENQTAKLVNLYNEGAHYLLIISIKAAKD